MTDKEDNKLEAGQRRIRLNSGQLPIPEEVDDTDYQNRNISDPLVTTAGQIPAHEIYEQSVHVYRDIIYEECERDHLDTRPLDNAFPLPQEQLNENHWPTDFAREFRLMADSFRRSKERQRVRDRANQVQIEQIDRASFMHLLRNLFGDGVTLERVIVFFFFCCDLVKRCVCQSRDELCRRFIHWSLQFLRDYVCNWVQEHGGWIALLSHSIKVYKEVATVLLICSAFVCGAYFLFKRRM